MKQNSKRTLTPKLRFPEFRDRGEWQTPQLSDLYDFKRTNTLSRDMLNYEAGTIRNIHYGDIHTKFQSLFRVENEHVPFINPETSVDAFEEEDDCEKGDIVLADASEDLNDVGKAIEIISLDEQRVVAGTHTILATRRGDVPIIGFGGHLFQSAAVRTGIQRESQGAKVYGISANRISSVALPLPPTNSEQQKIAECLNSLDGLIAAEGRKLAALRDHKRGLMQQLFPQPGQTQPRLRFPEFRGKGEWVETTLGEECHSVSSGKDKCDPDGQFDLYGSTGVIDKTCHATFTGAALLVARVGANAGLLTKAEGEFGVTDNTLVINLKNLGNMDFFLYYLENLGLNRMIYGSGQPLITGGQLKALMLYLPGEQERDRIADCLTAVDTLIAAQAAKIESLKTHKHGLMQQLFSAPEEV